MTTIRFTQKAPNPDNQPLVNDYNDPLAYDLAADPMTVTVETEGYNDAGEPTPVQKVSQYPQADWTGEELQ